MKKISAGDFKTHCLQLMNEVSRDKESFLITKRGKPVAKLVPLENGTETFWGSMKGTVHIHGDIISSPNEEWEADNAS